MPIGLFLCFTPVVIAWVIQANRKPNRSESPTGRDRR